MRKLLDQQFFSWESSCDAEGYVVWELERLIEKKGQEFKGSFIVTIEYEEDEEEGDGE